MRISIIIICIFVSIELSFAQNGTNEWTNTINTFAVPGSNEGIQDSTILKEYNREVNIRVIPEEAAEALITIIKSGIISSNSTTEMKEKIVPDTLGTWKAPLSIILPTGNYIFVVNKELFKNKTVKYEVGRKRENNINIELSPNEELLKIKEQLQILSEPQKLERNVEINVKPVEASNASISIIRTANTLVNSNSVNMEEIVPDTIGTWKAPISLTLTTGSYYIVANKEGFQRLSKKINIGFDSETNFDLEMISISYLQQKEKKWSTIKWISGAVLLGASAACLFLNSKITKNSNDYSNSIDPVFLKNKHNDINSYNRSFQIVSGVGIAALTSFAASWFIQNTYKTNNK